MNLFSQSTNSNISTLSRLKSKSGIKFISFVFLKDISTVAATCIAANCDTCDINSSFCKSCTNPYSLNSFGYCDTSHICEFNQFYRNDIKKCDNTCPDGLKENCVLNMCEKINSCSINNNIGNKYMVTEFNAPIFSDLSQQIYMQCSVSDTINIYDSTTLQFQAQIVSDMKLVSKQIYEPSNQNIVISNTQGDIEVWNVLSTNQVFKTKVTNYDATNIFYVTGVKLFFYINSQRFLTVIDDFSQPPHVLPYYLNNTDFSYVQIDNPKSVIFAGTQQELLHIAVDSTYSLIYWNKYNTTIPTTGLELYRPTLFSSFVMLYRFKTAPLETIIYYPTTQKWIRTDQISATNIGLFLDKISTKNTTHIQPYDLADDGKLIPLGPGYLLQSTSFFMFDNNTKCFGLTVSVGGFGPHVRFDVDTSPEKKFKDGMISNIAPFSIQITNFVLLDDVNRRIIIRSADGNLYVLNIDSLKVVYSLKQFQLPILAVTDTLSMISTRVDTSNQSNLVAMTLYSAQSINIYSHKKKFRSINQSSQFWNLGITKDFVLGQLYSPAQILVFKLSNMQKVTSVTYAATLDSISKCTNPIFQVSSTSNDFITACKTKIVYQAYSNLAYTNPATYTLKNAIFTIKELQKHMIVCYLVECYYHLKTTIATATIFLNNLNGCAAINVRSDQPYFSILSNTSYVLFYDYATWTKQQNFTLPSSCYQFYSSGFIEGNKHVFACKPDATTQSTVFFILKLNTTAPATVTCNTVKIDRITTFMNIQDSSTILSIYSTGVKLYIYMYGFSSDLTQVIEKAQNLIVTSSQNPNPYWDPILRRIFWSYSNSLYSNSRFIGESRYYDILDSANTNQILKFKRCQYNSYVIGILRSGSIHISDHMRKLTYTKSVADVTDILIDSTQDTVFYVVNNSYILYRYNYALDSLSSFTHTSYMTDMTYFTQSTFSNVFIITNKINLDVSFCQYTNSPIDMKCYVYKITQSSSDQLISTVTCFYNSVYILDTKTYTYYFLVDPTKDSNQISVVLSYVTLSQGLKVYPDVSIIVTQQSTFRDGLISNLLGAPLSKLSLNSEVIDIIAVQNDYFFVCPKILFRLTKNFIVTSSISTFMVVKKAVYYSKKNVILIISTQRSFYNTISFYDVSTSLQLQSVQIGQNPLEDLIYHEEEDIFVAYSIYGQIFRIDLNKPDQEDYIVNQLEADTGSLVSNYFPKLFFNKIVNKMFFANQNTVHKWNYSPFIGERLNYRRIRYLTFSAVQHTKNLDLLYYSDVQGFVWSFNSNSQKLISQLTTEVVDLHMTPDYFVALSLTNILVFQVNDYSNTLLNNITLTTTTIQMSMKFKQQIFGYITHDFEFYILDLTTNPQTAAPVKIATLSTTPQDFILISDDTVIISLLSTNPVKYKYGDTQFTVLTQFPILKTLQGSQLLVNEQNMILIDEKNIIKFNPTTFVIVSQLNFSDLDQAGMIESYAFDDKLNVIYIHYLTENYVQIIPYTLNKPDITYIGCCDIYSVKFLISDLYVAIYCFFQINFHSRESTKLNYLYQFRKPTVVKSMINLIILNESYLVITQTDAIMIFSMTPVTQGIRQFTLYRTISSIRAQIFQTIMNDQNSIKIMGAGYDGYFNNQIVLGSSCENVFSSVKNKLNLKNQLNKININEENIQKYYYFEVQLDSSVQFTNLPFIDEMKFKNNNAQIEFVPQASGQILTLNNNTFSSTSVYDLIVQDFTFMIPKDNNNIVFNPSTKSIIFKSISITSDLKNVSFVFNNVNKIVIDQLIISDITLTDCILFQASNIKNIYISNLSIINTRFVRSQILNIIDSNNITFQSLQLISLKLFEYQNQMLINIKNSDSFKINTFLFRDIIGTDISSSQDRSSENEVFERDNLYLSQQLNHIIYLQKIKSTDISSGSCLQLKKISMIKTEDLYTDGVILQKLEFSLLKMTSIIFKSNIAMNSLVFIKVSNIVLNQLAASANQCSDCNGGVLFIYQSSNLDIQNSVFELNKAIHGGSIAHVQCNKQKNNGKNNTFSQNSAVGNGGALYLENCDQSMSSTSFVQNRALIGGAIRYKELVPLFVLNIKNNPGSVIFKDNKCDYYGKNYGSYLGKITLEKLQNSVVLGNYTAKNQTFQSFFIDGFSSGDDIEIFVKILDEEQDLIYFNSSALSVSKKIPNTIRSEFQKIILNMVPESDEILIEGANFATYQQFNPQQLFAFPTNRLISQPTKSGSIFIQTNVDFEIPDYYLSNLSEQQLKDSHLLRNLEQQTQTINRNQFQISINFGFRDCVQGEIYQNISDTKTSCFRCPLGSYSLEEPDYFKKQECTQCSQIGTKECGNNTIILQNGFWRLDNFSDVIVECGNRKENCIDGPNTIGYCVKGLVGPLCEQCDVLGNVWGQPYSQTLEFQCVPCTNFFDTYVRWILIFVGVNIYIVGTLFMFFQIYRQKSIIYYLRQSGIISFGNSARRDQSSTYLKFLINYSQLQSNINQFKYDLFVLSIPRMFGQPVSQLNTATDCQVVVYQNLLLVKTAAMLCLPILFYIWICFVYLLKSIVSRCPDGYWKLSRMKLFTLFLFSFTAFQPNIVSFLIQSLSCRLIGTKKYVSSDITMECYNQEHKYVIMLACTGILLWVVMVPLYIYKKLKSITHTEWITIQYRYGFFYLEFKKKMIHWELIRLYLKLFVVIFVNLLSDSPVTQFTCLSITVFLYYHLIHAHSPYETQHMNKIDKQIIISLSVQIILNAILKDIADKFSITHLAIMFVAVAVNLGTFMFLVLVILSQKITFIRQNLIKIKYKLQQIKCLSKLNFLQVADEIENNFKRFQNWKHLSSNLQYAIAQCQRVKYQQLRENYIQRSGQVRGAGTTVHNRSTDQQYVKESMGFDMMFKELDSITVKRGGLNSSFQNGLKIPGKKLIAQKSLYNSGQVNLTMEGDFSPKGTNLIKDSVTDDKANMELLNSVKQNPYQNTQFAKAMLPKLSLTNSPLLINSSNSLNNTFIPSGEKASPFKLMHNGIIGKNLTANRSTIDNTPINENENTQLQQFSGSTINNLNSYPAFSNNLISFQPSQQQVQTQKQDRPSILKYGNNSFNDLADLKAPSSISNNTSAIHPHMLLEKEENEERGKFESVGLKSYNSQVIPKVLNDEVNNNSPPNHPRQNTSSESSNGEIDAGEDNLPSNQRSLDGSINYGNLQALDSPALSNMPSQLDRYSTPTDHLMNVTKR